MSEYLVKFVDSMSNFGPVLLIVIGILVVLLIGIFCYLIYIEKRNSAWLNQRKSSVKAVYSLKRIPVLYSIQLTRVYRDYINSSLLMKYIVLF